MDLWVTIKKTNIYITWVLEGKKGKKRAGSLFKEILATTFPNVGQESDIQIQGAQTVAL